jgi:hypothetical protein
MNNLHTKIDTLLMKALEEFQKEKSENTSVADL